MLSGSSTIPPAVTNVDGLPPAPSVCPLCSSGFGRYQVLSGFCFSGFGRYQVTRRASLSKLLLEA
eukprot:1419605-Pyramimonas_sp.AAC.1